MLKLMLLDDSRAMQTTYDQSNIYLISEIRDRFYDSTTKTWFSWCNRGLSQCKFPSIYGDLKHELSGSKPGRKGPDNIHI